MRDQASEAQQFETIAKHMGVKSFEKRPVNDEIAGRLGLQARYCGLVVRVPLTGAQSS